MRLAVCAISSLLLLGCDVPTGADSVENAHVIQAMQSRYRFRVLTADGTRPAVYKSPHRAYSGIIVYGDYSSKEIAEICEVARTVRREIATKPMRLYFYPREHVDSGLLKREILE